MIAIIGTSDQPCWLAEACKILLLLLLLTIASADISVTMVNQLPLLQNIPLYGG